MHVLAVTVCVSYSAALEECRGKGEELPRLLTFEHLHLSTDEKAEARTLLATLGYREIGWHKDDAAFVLNRGPTIT